MDFILGCNYWASNAGADMWRNFDLKLLKKILRRFRKTGLNRFVLSLTGEIFSPWSLFGHAREIWHDIP